MKPIYSFMIHRCEVNTNDMVVCEYTAYGNHFGGSVAFRLTTLKAEVTEEHGELDDAMYSAVIQQDICLSLISSLCEEGFNVARVFFSEDAALQLAALVATPQGS